MATHDQVEEWDTDHTSTNEAGRLIGRRSANGVFYGTGQTEELTPKQYRESEDNVLRQLMSHLSADMDYIGVYARQIKYGFEWSGALSTEHHVWLARRGWDVWSGQFHTRISVYKRLRHQFDPENWPLPNKHNQT